MKNKIYSLLTVIVFTISISTFAQTPPPPNNNNGAPTSGGNTPVGGGAPIAGGYGILIVLGLAYGMKKVYQFNKTENEYYNY